MRGVIFVISSPTGVGKTTICELIQKRRSDVKRVITHTTRAPRQGELNGVDYYFVSEQEFKNMIKNGEFVEFAVVHNHYYGTSKKALTDVMEEGKNPILAIDVQGAKNIMNWINRVVSIFILPPSFEAWMDRLNKDKNRDNLKIRLKTALNEFSEIEHFDYCIINDKLEDAVESLSKIIDVANMSVNFHRDKYTKLAKELKEKTQNYLEG